MVLNIRGLNCRSLFVLLFIVWCILIGDAKSTKGVRSDDN